MASTRPRVVISLIFQAIFYTLFGGIIAYLVWASRDLWLAGTIASTLHRLHHRHGGRPRSQLGDLVAGGLRHPRVPAGVVAHVFRRQADEHPRLHDGADDAWLRGCRSLSPARGMAWAIGRALLLDIYATSTATTLAIALGYATVLRAVGPDAIERVLSYVQMIMSFAVYGGQFLISGVLSRTAPGPGRCPASPLILLYPGTWFGSYLELAERPDERRARSRAPLRRSSPSSLMASRLGGRLSLQYSEALGAMTVAARARAARRRREAPRGGVLVHDRRSAGGRAARAQPVPPRSPVPHGRARACCRSRCSTC